MIKIMVADDNKGLNSTYCNFLTKDKDIQVISQTTDGEETLEKYLDLKPDLLLLDLDMPKLNGLEIINTLCKNTDKKNKCNIIVISGNSDMRYNLFNTAKVYRIMPKPVELDYVLHVIKEFQTENSLSKTISEKDIRKLLIDFNVKPYSRNSNFLTDAILASYQKPFLLRNIKNLYEEIGIKNCVSFTTIKWSIRNSICTINKNIPTELLHSIFHLDSKDTITPKYFFTMIIEYFEAIKN